MADNKKEPIKNDLRCFYLIFKESRENTAKNTKTGEDRQYQLYQQQKKQKITTNQIKIKS